MTILSWSVLQMVSGFMITGNSLTDYRSVWLLLTIGMAASFIAALLTKDE